MLYIRMIMMISDFIDGRRRRQYSVCIKGHESNNIQLSPFTGVNWALKTGECKPDPSSLDCGPSSVVIGC